MLYKIGKLIIVFALGFGLIRATDLYAETADEAKKRQGESKGIVEEEFQLEPLTVTAEKREENVQKIPISITTLSDMEIEDGTIAETEDLVFRIPNLSMIKAGHHSTGGFLTIRGITSWMAGEPTVGFYVDDVYYNTFDTELLDVERIEVLKGPQGTLYGRNTEAGVINIVSKLPTDVWEGLASAEYGNYNTQSYKAAISGPVVEDILSFRVAAQQTLSDGYFNNTFLDDDKTDSINDFNIRGAARWTPTHALDIRFSSSVTRYRDDNSSFASLDQVRQNPHDVSVDFTGSSDYDASNHSLRVGYESDLFHVTSVTAIRNEETSEINDLDFTSLDLMRLDAWEEDKLFSQEVRFASPDDGRHLKWLMGLYYFAEDKNSSIDMETRQETELPAPYPSIPAFSYILESDTEVTGYALFGQTSLRFFEKFKLTAGLRYDHEEKKYSAEQYYSTDLSMFGMEPASLDTDADWDELLPKLTLDYSIRPGLMTYASLARGYKSGGFNLLAPTSEMSYDPEYTINYEIGAKSAWADNRLLLNMALFYIDWKDQQIEQQAYPSAITRNAGSSTSQGFEVDLTATPYKGLELSSGFGYVDATFDDYVDDVIDTGTGAVVGTVDYGGNEVPNVPDYTWHLAAKYRNVEGFFARVSLQGVGSFYYDSANTKEEGAYETVDARIGWEWEHFQVYLWGKNIFDAAYATRAFEMDGSWFGRAGDPPTCGITLQGRF